MPASDELAAALVAGVIFVGVGSCPKVLALHEGTPETTDAFPCLDNWIEEKAGTVSVTTASESRIFFMSFNL